MTRFNRQAASLTAFVRVRLSDESGIALPVSVVMISLVLALGAVAVGQATSATDSTDRDSQVKRAGQAAEAGAEAALARLNSFSASNSDPLSTEPRCLQSVVDPATGPTIQRVAVDETTGWCPPSAAEQIGNEESYRYTVSGLRLREDPASGDALGIEGYLNFGPPYLNGTIDQVVVSTGCASPSGAACDPYAPGPDDVTRRVAVQTSAIDVSQLFTDYAAVSNEDLVLENQSDVGSPEVAGNARSNASIFLNHPNAEIFGDAIPGPTDLDGNGHAVEGKGQVHGSSTPAPNEINFPPVDMPDPADVDGQVCSVVLVDEDQWDYICPASSYDPATRVLDISGGRVVLRGNTFSFCQIRSTNNTEIWLEPLDPGRPVQIYIDSPDNCQGQTISMSLTNRPRIVWGWEQETGQPTLPGLQGLTELTYPIAELYVVGDDPPTSITYENNNTDHTSALEIYAPHSNVTLQNHAKLEGGVIANRLTMSNNTIIYPAEANLPGSLSGVVPEFERGLFTECASDPAPADQPALGCW